MNKDDISMRYNPNEPEKLDNIISGSYDDFVRLERRNLIITSSIMLVSFYWSIVPNSIRIFGFSFSCITESSLFGVLFLTCLYFFITYITYAYPNYRKSKQQWENLKSQAMIIAGNKHRPSIEIKNIISSGRYKLWMFINYLFPVIIGLPALIIGILKMS